jgi:hypothetical protein
MASWALTLHVTIDAIDEVEATDVAADVSAAVESVNGVDATYFEDWELEELVEPS